MQTKTVVFSSALITYHDNQIIANKKTPVLMQISEKHYPVSGLFPLPGIVLLYRLINYFHFSELAAAVPADVAVVPRDYVVGIAVRASIHYAALHW